MCFNFVENDACVGNMEYRDMDSSHQYTLVYCVYCCFDILCDALLFCHIFVSPVDGQVTKPQEVSQPGISMYYTSDIFPYSNIYGPWDEAVLNKEEQER